MSNSLLQSVFSPVVSNIENDVAEEPQKSTGPGVRLVLGAFLAGVLIVSVIFSLTVRLWNRVEMFFEMVQ
ncbi:MAG: hypothetical protein KA165_16605 [Saprospiraceae bacterium]|nr:hypothetical protein [Saprospiraceae bacterium]